MSSSTTNAASAQGTSQAASSATTTAAATAASTSGNVVTRAPPASPSMEFPKPAVLQHYTTAPNISTVTTTDAAGNRQVLVLEDNDAPVPLQQRVTGCVKGAGEATANCCLGCVCHVCCGI